MSDDVSSEVRIACICGTALIKAAHSPKVTKDTIKVCPERLVWRNAIKIGHDFRPVFCLMRLEIGSRLRSNRIPDPARIKIAIPVMIKKRIPALGLRACQDASPKMIAVDGKAAISQPNGLMRDGSGCSLNSVAALMPSRCKNTGSAAMGVPKVPMIRAVTTESFWMVTVMAVPRKGARISRIDGNKIAAIATAQTAPPNPRMINCHPMIHRADDGLAPMDCRIARSRILVRTWAKIKKLPPMPDRMMAMRATIPR